MVGNDLIMKKSISFFILFFLTVVISCNKEEINELEKRNEELIAQTNKLQEQIVNLTTDVNTLTIDVSNLSSSNDVLSSSNNDLLNKITLLQTTINELEEALNNMTDDYEFAEAENNQLYDDYSGLLNSKNELQAQLDNLISEINTISCPPIELASPIMMTEQLFCTYQYINPLIFEFDESVYNFSFTQDSIPSGIVISKTQGKVEIFGTPFNERRDLFSFDLNFISEKCEIVKKIVLARSPNSPSIGLESGSKSQSITSGNQIEKIDFTFGGSAEGLSFTDLPEGLTYSLTGNKYSLEGTISEAGSYSFQISTVNQSGCSEIYETVNKNYKYLVTLTEKAPSEYIGKYIDAIVSILSNCGSRLQSDNPNVFKENFMGICYKLCLKENNLIPKYRFKLMDICDKYENNWTVSDSDWNKV